MYASIALGIDIYILKCTHDERMNFKTMIYSQRERKIDCERECVSATYFDALDFQSFKFIHNCVWNLCVSVCVQCTLYTNSRQIQYLMLLHADLRLDSIISNTTLAYNGHSIVYWIVYTYILFIDKSIKF